VPRFKFVKGFQTGDMVKAIVPQGKKAGIHTGRVAVRSTGSFNITTALMSGSRNQCQILPLRTSEGRLYLQFLAVMFCQTVVCVRGENSSLRINDEGFRSPPYQP
jgi:hypothetical protein